MAEDRKKLKRGNYLRSGSVINGYKICPGCKIKKSIAKFYKDKFQASGITSLCKKCNNIQCRKWQKGKGREKVKIIEQRSSWKKQGIAFTPEEYNEKFAVQKGCCAICDGHQSKFKRKLAVDHDHKTGQIRALVCTTCNYVIGAVESNGDKIPKVQKYLKVWRIV